MPDDSYRIVTGTFLGKTDMAVMMQPPHNPRRAQGRQCSIPRSLIHGADDREVPSLQPGTEWTFRLMDWKAEELGFA